MHPMEISHTVNVGINSTFLSKSDEPFATESLMEPIPRALMDDPPTPVTVLSAMGCNVKKSDQSGEMWVVHMLSRRKGNVSKERSI